MFYTKRYNFIVYLFSDSIFRHFESLQKAKKLKVKTWAVMPFRRCYNNKTKILTERLYMIEKITPYENNPSCMKLSHDNTVLYKNL